MDIFEAATTGNQDRVKELAKETPEIVNKTAANGKTPMYFAAEAGQVDMVLLLSIGMFQAADVEAGSESPIIPIADYGDPVVAMDMALPLLANGANPNVKRKDGATALHVAAARGNIDVARMLIHRGAIVDPKDAVVAKAIPDAAKIERAYFGARYLQDLHGNKPPVSDRNGLSQVAVNEFVVLAHTQAEVVKRMHKANPALGTARAIWDESPIEAAAHMGLYDLALYFAEAGATISTCTAVILGLTDVVAKNLREDRNCVHERGAHDFPILSYTAFGPERTEIASMLLKAGANPNGFGFFGLTPLHAAAGKGHLEVAKLLLEYGADINPESKSRKGPRPTPLATAIQKKQTKMADFLTSKGAKS
jgi:ankyrin repeat protein